MNKLKHNLLELIYFLIPIMYMAYIIYMRLIRTRVPRDVAVFSSPILVYSTAFILLVLLLRLYFLLKSDGLISRKQTNNHYILKIKEKISSISDHVEYIKRSFIEKLSRNISFYDDILIKISQILFLTVPSKKFTVFTIIFNMVPRMIVVLAFLIDVFYFKQLHYFYKLVGFLLLPLFFSILHKMVEEFYSYNIQDLIDLLDSKPIPGSECDEFCYNTNKRICNTLPPLEIHLLLNFYPVYEIPYHLGEFERIKKKHHFNKIKILVCILYMLGWTQIFLTGIGFL